MTNIKGNSSSPLSLIEQYQRTFAAYGDTPAGVMWPRGRQALRFKALTQHFSPEGFSVLDYGCGLAHLKDYLDENFKDYEYRGADIVPEFVQAAVVKHPGSMVKLGESHVDVTTPVDHVVISGPLTSLKALIVENT